MTSPWSGSSQPYAFTARWPSSVFTSRMLTWMRPAYSSPSSLTAAPTLRQKGQPSLIL